MVPCPPFDKSHSDTLTMLVWQRIDIIGYVNSTTWGLCGCTRAVKKQAWLAGAELQHNTRRACVPVPQRR